MFESIDVIIAPIAIIPIPTIRIAAPANKLKDIRENPATAKSIPKNIIANPYKSTYANPPKALPKFLIINEELSFIAFIGLSFLSSITGTTNNVAIPIAKAIAAPNIIPAIPLILDSSNLIPTIITA